MKPKLKNDIVVSIAVGPSRKSKRWKTKRMNWSDLVGRLSEPTRTQETMTEWAQMSKTQKSEVKDVGGFVGGTFIDEMRKSENVQSRSLITLDLDNVPKQTDPWETVTAILDYAACIYSTHSHLPEKPRLRLVMPLTREVSGDEYIPIARMIASDIGIEFCDDTTFEPERLMYWPSCSIDAEYRFAYNDGDIIVPDEILARYDNWKDPSEWPRSSRAEVIIERMRQKQQDPKEKTGVIGGFCRAYSIEDAIETFLPDVYTKMTEGRYTYTNGSTAGGLVLYDNGNFAYSHHGTDPISGMLVNSFDLVRIHKFGKLDDDAWDKPTEKRPSYKAMIEFAESDPVVRRDVIEQNISAFDDEAAEVNNDWHDKLEVDKKGGLKASVNNVVLILMNDPKLVGNFGFDDFFKRPRVYGDLPWGAPYAERVSDSWSDVDDSGLRWYLEKVYNIDYRSKIADAVNLAMNNNKRHPVREYLESLEWDGKERIETLFIDLLGAEDNKYTRAVTRKSLIGAVARIFEPGCKYDYMPVLVGPQGCGKSMTLSKLGGKWFSDSLYTVQGKDAYEQVQGAWIIEMAEMAATKKSEIEQIKQFISKQVDTFRAAYAARTASHPRQCVFFGTTNDDVFLKDITGGRRFWPIDVTGKDLDIDEELRPEVVDQIWAEAVTYYRLGEKWRLDRNEERLAAEQQDLHTEKSELIGMIEQYVDMPVPSSWYSMSLVDRRTYIFAENDAEREAFTSTDGVMMIRQHICALEVWCELMAGDIKAFNKVKAREINECLKSLPQLAGGRYSMPEDPLYGRQKGYKRNVSVYKKMSQ